MVILLLVRGLAVDPVWPLWGGEAWTGTAWWRWFSALLIVLLWTDMLTGNPIALGRRWVELPPWRLALSVVCAGVFVSLVLPPILGGEPFLAQRDALQPQQGPLLELSVWTQPANTTSPWHKSLLRVLLDDGATPGNALTRQRVLWLALYGLLVWHAFRRVAGERRSALFWFLAANPLPILAVAMQAREELLLALLWYLALAALRAGQVALAAGALTFTLAVQPLGVLLLPPVAAHALRRDKQRGLLGLVVGLVAGAGLVLLVCHPHGGPWAFWQSWWQAQQAYLCSFAALFMQGPGWNPVWITLAGWAVVAGIVAVVSLRARTFRQLIDGLHLIVLAALLLGVSSFQWWHLLWFVPLVVAGPWVLQDRRWLLGAAILGITAFWGGLGIPLVTGNHSVAWASLLCLMPITLYLAWLAVTPRARDT